MTEAATGTGTKRWYVVHAYSGMEKSVARALQERISPAGLQSQFGQILVPVEEVVEVKGGKKSITVRRMYSGYSAGRNGDDRRGVASGRKSLTC